MVFELGHVRRGGVMPRVQAFDRLGAGPELRFFSLSAEKVSESTKGHNHQKHFGCGGEGGMGESGVGGGY